MADSLLDELVRAARRCDRGAAMFKKDPVSGMIRRLMDACHEIGQAWSSSFIGYHATVYKNGLRPVLPGEYFSSEWGPMDSRGEWAEYSFDGVKQAIEQLAEISDLQPINDAVTVAREAFDSGRDDILPAIDAILSSTKDETLKGLRDKIAN